MRATYTLYKNSECRSIHTAEGMVAEVYPVGEGLRVEYHNDGFVIRQTHVATLASAVASMWRYAKTKGINKSETMRVVDYSRPC